MYVLWETGLYTNTEIGELFGVTYSAVSRRAGITKARIEGDRTYRKTYKILKSQIKM